MSEQEQKPVEEVVETIPTPSPLEDYRKLKAEAESQFKEAKELAIRTSIETVTGNKEKYPFLLANNMEKAVYDKAHELGVAFHEAAEIIEAQIKEHEVQKFKKLSQYLSPPEVVEPIQRPTVNPASPQSKAVQPPTPAGKVNKNDPAYIGTHLAQANKLEIPREPIPTATYYRPSGPLLTRQQQLDLVFPKQT